MQEEVKKEIADGEVRAVYGSSDGASQPEKKKKNKAARNELTLQARISLTCFWCCVAELPGHGVGQLWVV